MTTSFPIDHCSDLLEVKIAPKDIDQIALGHKAILRMSAFNLRTTPELNGRVSRIAADLSTDERTGLSHYLVRLSVSAEEMEKLESLTLMPDRKSTRLNSRHQCATRMPSSA